MSYKYYGLDDSVQRWNRQLSYYLKIDNQDKALEAEMFIIQDPDFISAIENAREKLGITEHYVDVYSNEMGVGEFYSWFDSKMKELHSNKRFGDLAQVASDICAEINLPYGWSDYISAYICLNERPSNIAIEPDSKIDIIGIEHDDSLIIRLEKGISRADYIAAWKTFSNYFKENPAVEHTDDAIKYRILLDNVKNGMSAGKIAKKYFPFDTVGLTKYEITSKTQLNRDKVKKILQRLKVGDKKVF